MVNVSHRSIRNRVGLNVNAADFGLTASASGETNRAALQRAIDTVSAAGWGEVFVPNGTYTFGQYSTFGWCLLLKSGVHIVGESEAGVVLKQDASMAASVRLFYTTNAVDAGLAYLTLDGNKANQTVNEHRHGVFIDGAVGLTIEQVTARNFTGDGFYVYTDSSGLDFKSCTATLNDRSGVTIGRTCDDVEIRGCTLTLNGAQEIDFEPATTDDVHDVRIIGNVIGEAGTDTDYVIAIGGTSSDGLTDDVLLRGNTINGSILVVWATDVEILGNTITVSGSNTPCIKVYRNCAGVTIEGNTLNLTRTFASSDEHTVVELDATGVGNQPDDIVIRGNTMTMSYPNTAGPTIGVLVRGALSFTAEYNTITGNGGTAGAGYDGGFLLRGNVAGGPYTVRYNTIRNIGVKGVLVYDAQTISAVDVSYNDIDDTQAVPTMTVGIDLYDGTENVAVITCVGNVVGNVIATAIDYPPTKPVRTGTTHEGHPVYTGEAAPEGVVTATRGAIFTRVSTLGVVISTYEKQSDNTNVGWVAI